MCQNQTYTYAYDLRGNRIAETGKKESREYVYDETNRLVEGTNWKGDKSAYTYNGLGVRINNTHTTHSGSERIEQFTDRSRGGYERLLYVHEDLQGNTRYYTKANGQSFAELTYDAWGMPESPNKLLNNDHGNYVYATYTGHIFDTTLDIYFCEARFYDASTRTWMAMDPVKDGGNWYQYCYGNPLKYWDPTGLLPESVTYFMVYGCSRFLKKTQIGIHAHDTLQDYFMKKFVPGSGGWGWTERTVTGYKYSKSGNGKIDILFYINTKYQVYELKPLSQYFQNTNLSLKIKENVADKFWTSIGRPVYPNGRQQRQGYIDALNASNFIVDPNGSSFNPDGVILIDKHDPARIFEYYTDYDNQPGMIYYKTYNAADENVAKIIVKAREEGKGDQEMSNEILEYYRQKTDKTAMDSLFSSPMDSLFPIPLPPAGMFAF